MVPRTSSPIKISVTLIAYNEEKHIAQAIQSAAWADEIIVIDSGSTDKTREIAEKAGAKVYTHAWPGYGQQKNYAHQKATGDWVLNIDADERVSPALANEIRSAVELAQNGKSPYLGFSFPRKTYYLGRWIRFGGWYPNRLTRLGRRDSSRWSEPAVHERLEIQGPVGELQEPLDHFTFDSIAQQAQVNLRYALLGSQVLRERGAAASLMRLIFKPWGKFFETYILKMGFRDGIAGFIISVNAAYSLFLKYAFLFDSRIRREPPA